MLNYIFVIIIGKDYKIKDETNKKIMKKIREISGSKVYELITGNPKCIRRIN